LINRGREVQDRKGGASSKIKPFYEEAARKVDSRALYISQMESWESRVVDNFETILSRPCPVDQEQLSDTPFFNLNWPWTRSAEKVSEIFLDSTDYQKR